MAKSEPILTADEATFAPKADLAALRGKVLIFALFGLGGAAVGLFLDQQAFLRAWLQGWLWSLNICVGMLALCMLNHQSGGLWGIVMRRTFEVAGKSLWLFLILSTPLVISVLGPVIGMELLPVAFPWADPEIVAHDKLIQKKVAYLNSWFWFARLLIYFAVWLGFAHFLASWSKKWDETGDPRWEQRLKVLAAAGLVCYVITVTFASVDWIMSIDPHWFSAIFGVAWVGGSGLGALSLTVALMVFMRTRKPMDRVLNKRLFHDYGKLMLAFTMLWTYFMIGQYIIIWSGNLPEEVGWFIDRGTNGWQLLSVALILGHFALPFVVLLSADLKKKPTKFIWVAVWVLAMRWLDYYWQVAPSFSRDWSVVAEGASHHPAESIGANVVTWLPVDILTALGIGALWLWFMLGQLQGRPLLPLHEPRVAQQVDAVAHEEAYAHG
ncbi:MAG: hypothetical protein AAGD38_15975 [Acidobacteriota bacterium]